MLADVFITFIHSFASSATYLQTKPMSQICLRDGRSRISSSLDGIMVEKWIILLIKWHLVYLLIILVTLIFWWHWTQQPKFLLTPDHLLMTSLRPSTVSEGGLVTPDVNLVRYMGGPWSDHFIVLGYSAFRAKANLIKQRRKITARFAAHF